MKSNPVLDFVIFQLTPTRTRCELYVVAGDVTEKLASGLFKPFSCHLRAAEEQLAKGGCSIRLEPPGPHESSWFTKGTIERFVRFVSTPEVLERVSTVEMELVQLEETVRMQTCNSAQADDPFLIDSPSGSSVGPEKPVPSTKMRRDSIDSNETGVGENSKKQLLKALDSRRMVLQKEQDMAFARAAAAGFDVGHLMELIAFSDCFGASRLREACVKFLSLHKRRQEAGLWAEDTDFHHREGASAHSNRSAISIIKQRGLSESGSLSNGHGMNMDEGCADLKVDLKASFNGEGRINSGDGHFEVGTTRSPILLGYSTVDSGQVGASLAEHDVKKAREIGVALDNTTHSFSSISSNYSSGRQQPNAADLLHYSKPAESFQHWSVNHAYRDSLCIDFQGCLPGVGLNNKECNDAFMQMSSSHTNGGIPFPRDAQDDHLPTEIRCLTQIAPSPRRTSPLPSCERMQIGRAGLKHSGMVVIKNINSIAPTMQNHCKDQQECSSTESSEGAGSCSDDADRSVKSKVNPEPAQTKNVIAMSELNGSEKCQNFGGTVMERWIDSPIFNADCSEKDRKHDGRLVVREVEAMHVNEISLLHGKERNGYSGKSANYVSDTKPGTTILNKFAEVQNSLAVVAPKGSSRFLRSSATSSHRLKDQLVTQDPEIGVSTLIDNSYSYIKQQPQQEMRPFDDSFFVSSHSLAREKRSLGGSTTLSMESGMQGNKNQDLMVKDRMKVNSNSINLEEPNDLFMVPLRKKESVTESWKNAASLDLQLLSGVSDRRASNHDMNLNTPSNERVKRFLDQYNEKREAKQREESSSKRTERETKMKAMQDILEKRKSEMGRNHRLEKAGFSAEAQLRADKLRAYKAGLQKNKKEKEEEERRRLEELKIQRRERIAARSNSSSFAVNSSTLQGHRSQRPKTIPRPANQLLQKAAAPVKSSPHGSSSMSSKQKRAKVKESSTTGLPPNLDRSSSIGVPKTSKISLKNSAPSVSKFRKEVGRTASTFARTGSQSSIQTKTLNRHQNSRSLRDGYSSVTTCRIEGKEYQLSHASVMSRGISGTEVKGRNSSTGINVKDLSGTARQQRLVRNSPEVKQNCRAFLKKGSGAAFVARNVVPQPKAASTVKMVKRRIAQERQGSPGALQTVKVVTQHTKEKGSLLSLVKTQIHEKENTRLKKKDQPGQMEISKPGEIGERAGRKPRVASVRAFQQSGSKMLSSSMDVEAVLSISGANDEFGKADEPLKGSDERKGVETCFGSAVLSLSPEHDSQKLSFIHADLGPSQVEVSYQERTPNPSTSALKKSPITINTSPSVPAAFEDVDKLPIGHASADPVLEDAATTRKTISPKVSPVFDTFRGNRSECQMKWDGTSRNPSSTDESPISVKEQTRGLKRLLRFGRRSIPSSKHGFADRILSSTYEGDEDGGEISIFRSRTLDGLGTPTNSNGNTSNRRASLNDIKRYPVSSLDFKGSRSPLPILPLKSPLSGKELQSEAQNQDILKGSTVKGSHSFFSFAFRSKASEGKPH